MNKIVIFVISGISMTVSAFLAFNALISLGIKVWLLILLLFVSVFAYTFIRAAYMKKHGRYLFKDLAAPYEKWEADEAKWKAADEGESI